MTEITAQSPAARCLELLDTRRESLLELAQELVRAPSENPPGDERPPGEVVKRWLRALDLDAEVETIEFAAGRPNLLIRVELGPGDSRTLSFCGHLDTVPVGDAARWSRDPISGDIADGRLHGRGALDMKGAVAASIMAVWALKQVAQRGSLMLLLVADEEFGSIVGADPLADSEFFLGDAIVVTEPSGVDQAFECVGVACRGVLRFDLVAHGREMHSSLSYRVPAANAALTLARAMLRTAEELPPLLAAVGPPSEWFPDGPTLTVGLEVRGGVRRPVVPGRASAYCEIRTVPNSDRSGLERCIEAYVDGLRETDGLDVRVEFDRTDLGWLLGSTVEASHPLVTAALAAASDVLGRSVPGGGCPGGTDARHFVNQAGIPTIASLGPGLIGAAHGYDEWVAIDEIVQAAKIYALTALNYFDADGDT